MLQTRPFGRFLPRCGSTLADTYQHVPLVPLEDLPRIEYQKKEAILRNWSTVTEARFAGRASQFLPVLFLLRSPGQRKRRLFFCQALSHRQGENAQVERPNMRCIRFKAFAR